MSQDPQTRSFTDRYPDTDVMPGQTGGVAVDDVLIIDDGPPEVLVDDTDNPRVDVAKDQAAQVGQGAVDAGKHVAGTAKDEAANVAAEAKSQARDVVGQARTEVRDQAHTQTQRVSQGLQSISRELGSMADGSQEQGLATDLARQASQSARDVASWLERRDPNEILDDVRSFARRRPGAFLGIALAAGIVTGRLTAGLKSDDTSGEAHTDITSNPQYGETTQGIPPYGATTQGML